MKTVTSVTVWNDAVGKRMSVTYSEIDETGKIISDNRRVDRVVMDQSALKEINDVMDYAQTFIE